MKITSNKLEEKKSKWDQILYLKTSTTFQLLHKILGFLISQWRNFSTFYLWHSHLEHVSASHLKYLVSIEALGNLQT